MRQATTARHDSRRFQHRPPTPWFAPAAQMFAAQSKTIFICVFRKIQASTPSAPSNRHAVLAQLSTPLAPATISTAYQPARPHPGTASKGLRRPPRHMDAVLPQKACSAYGDSLNMAESQPTACNIPNWQSPSQRHPARAAPQRRCRPPRGEGAKRLRGVKLSPAPTSAICHSAA